jgi:hypothetical protein
VPEFDLVAFVQFVGLVGFQSKAIDSGTIGAAQIAKLQAIFVDVDQRMAARNPRILRAKWSQVKPRYIIIGHICAPDGKLVRDLERERRHDLNTEFHDNSPGSSLRREGQRGSDTLDRGSRRVVSSRIITGIRLRDVGHDDTLHSGSLDPSTDSIFIVTLYTMIQLQVNLRLTFARLIGLFGLLMVLTQCSTPAPIRPLSPWLKIQKVADTPPVEQPALWISDDTVKLAWPGDPAAPGIQVATLDTPSKTVSLSIAPQQVSLIPAQDEQMLMLWLEPTLPGELRLVNVLLNEHYEVERGQVTASTRSTLRYIAVATPLHNTIILWIEANQNHTPLYAQLIDGQGRPRPPLLIAEEAVYPAAAFDQNDNLHVIWLQPDNPTRWSLQYTVFRKGEPHVGQSIPLGVIQLDNNRIIDGLSLSVDATHVYCLWSTLIVGNSPDGTPPGQIDGLMFPITDNTATHPITITMPEPLSLRWPQLAPATTAGLLASVTASRWDGRFWRDFPAAISFSPDGVGTLHPVSAPQPDQISKTTPFVDTDGTFHLAWSALKSDGTAAVYYATTRPVPTTH